MNEKIKLYNSDCLIEMKNIPDKSIDLLLTDPPYGIGIDGQKLSICKNPKHNRKSHEFKGWDNSIPAKEYFNEMFRITKNQIIFGGNYFTEYLKPSKGWIVWDKGQYNLSMSDGELIYTSFEKALRILHCNRAQLLRDGSFHPTQKPLLILYKILETLKDVETIIDPFMGSGSTGVACINTNRNFIGIEKDEKYFQIAKKRIDEAVENYNGLLFK